LSFVFVAVRRGTEESPFEFDFDDDEDDDDEEEEAIGDTSDTKERKSIYLIDSRCRRDRNTEDKSAFWKSA